MFKLIKVSVIVVIVMFMTTQTELKSQTPPGCPPDATNSITTTFTVDGCDFEVQICWKCTVTSSPLWYAVTGIHPVSTCNPFVDTRDALDSIYYTLRNYAWLYTFCGTEIPPCSTGTYAFSERRYNCYIKYQPSGTPLPPVWNIVCDFDTWCQKDYEACMLSPGNMQLTVINDWYQIGTPTCTSVEPPNPLPGHDSVCWLFKPNCD